MAHILNSGRLKPRHYLRIAGRDAIAAQHEPDIREFTMQKARGLDEISVVLNRVSASNQADYGHRARNSQLIASRYTLRWVGFETVQIKAVGNDLHPVGRVSKIRMESPRRFRATDDARGK